MFIRTTALSQKKRQMNKWFILICFALLSVYPIYSNFYYSNGLLTYERHRAVIEKRSEFYNPWQYRVLCPYLVEAGLWVYNHTLDKVFPIEQKFNFNIESTSGTSAETDTFVQLMQTPGAVKYMLIFIIFRWLEHMLIFYLTWKLLQYFIQSDWLIFLGINFLALSFGNAVNAADLSFNTYMDIIFYLLTALLILYHKNPLWLIPVTILAALNRETGLLIPALYFISKTDFTALAQKPFRFKNMVFPGIKTWVFTVVLYILFMGIFIYLRWYFGYRPQQVWKVPAGLPMLKLNLLSAVGVKAWLELIGTFGMLPLLILYKFKSFPHLLKKWFIFLVPVWFGVHYVSVVAYQTRLFMVPMILIFIPMVLYWVENDIIRKSQTQTAIN